MNFDSVSEFSWELDYYSPNLRSVTFFDFGHAFSILILPFFGSK